MAYAAQALAVNASEADIRSQDSIGNQNTRNKKIPHNIHYAVSCIMM